LAGSEAHGSLSVAAAERGFCSIDGLWIR
jgi:hypothetical protein